MNTITQVIDAKWFYQIKNGNDFTAATGDFTRNLSGNIFEKVMLKARLISFTSIPIIDYFITDESIYKSSAGFSEDIKIGDQFRIFLNESPVFFLRGIVTSVSEDLIYYDLIINTGISYNILVDQPSRIVIESPLTFLRYEHGLRPNSSVDNFYRSYLDNQNTAFLVSDLGIGDPRDTNFRNGIKIARNSNTGTFRARYVENDVIPINDHGGFESAQIFEIEHIFTIQDFSENDIRDYINNTQPDNYLGATTLDYNSAFEFRTVETNPETSKIGRYVSSGNVGFFDENFNGRPNDFFIKDLVITRESNGAELDNLASSEPCIVTFTLRSRDLSSFEDVDPAIVMNHFALVTDYQFSELDFDDLFSHELLRIEGTNTINGNIFTELTILSFNDSEINIRFRININRPELEGLNYKLSVLVENPGLPNDDSNKVQLTVKNGVYQDDFDIEGLIDNASLEIFQRDCNPAENIENGFSSFPIISGELVNTKFNFSVVDGEIVRVSIGTVGVEDGNNFIIDRDDIDISELVTIGGIQRVDSIIPTPYSSGIDGSFKWLGNMDYEVIFPFRMPYEKEIEVAGLSETLFDLSEPNNGFNQSAIYQQSRGINIHIFYIVSMLKDGRVTDYLFRSPVIEVIDFETNL